MPRGVFKRTAEHVEKIRQANLGRKRSLASRLRMRAARLGKPLPLVTKLKLSVAQKAAYSEGRRVCTLNAATQAKTAAKAALRTGSKHPRWIEDRSQLSSKGSNRSMAHETWRRSVRRRFPQCVLSASNTCEGRLEVHHIESFAAHPELRYDVDNGITLCRKHHPRKHSEADKLAPMLKAKVLSKKGEIGNTCN